MLWIEKRACSGLEKEAYSEYVKALNGSDAVIYRVCKGSSLMTSLNTVYCIDGEKALVPITNLLGDYQYDNEILYVLCHEHGGRIIHEFDRPAPDVDYVNKKYSIKLA